MHTSYGTWISTFLQHHTHQQTAYLDMLYSHVLLSVITTPTRITSHTAALIDHIYTNTVKIIFFSEGYISGVTPKNHLQMQCKKHTLFPISLSIALQNFIIFLFKNVAVITIKHTMGLLLFMHEIAILKSRLISKLPTIEGTSYSHSP